MPFAMIGLFLGFNNWHRIKEELLNAQSIKLHHAFFANEFFLIGVLVIFCMVFARSAAMAFNRYLDRQWDAKNPRTAVREIPTGIITPKNALSFTIISSLLFIVCTFFINRLCFYLSPVALAVVLGYSYTKRFTPLCHLILGLGLSLAPIGAYLAVTGQFALLPILFSLSLYNLQISIFLISE